MCPEVATVACENNEFETCDDHQMLVWERCVCLSGSAECVVAQG